MRAIPLLGPAAAALLALLAAAGCGSPDETRFDAIPGPLRTADIAAAAAVEEVPLSEDEWASIESMHDRYLQDFDAVRRDTLAPLAREVREALGADLADDGATLARLGKRTAAALARIKSLDDRLSSELADAFRSRAAFAERLSHRRAIDRSAKVIEGESRSGEGMEPTILDLEVTVAGCGLSREDRLRIEPALAEYRHELSRAAAAAAEEWLEFPARFLAMRESAGVGPARLGAIEAAAGAAPEDSDERRLLDAARSQLAQLRGRAALPRTRAYQAIDSAAVRALEPICAALPEEAAARLRAAELRARGSDDESVDVAWRSIDAARAHPAVREGRAPDTAKAAAALREAIERLLRLRAARIRADFAAASGNRTPGRPEDPELREAYVAMSRAGAPLLAAIAKECPEGDLAGALGEVGSLTPSAAVDRLAPAIGRAAAEWVVSRSCRAAFRSPQAADDFDFDDKLSFAEQLLLAPGMDHAAFRRAARALGARDDDPLVEQLWERHQARVAALEDQQRRQLKLLEKDAMDLARRGEERAAELERAIAGYLQALLVADGERREADDALFEEIAIAIGIPRDDPRMALARAISSARRASLPWRRFRLPWFLGPLWESDSDPLSMALAENDEVRRTAAVIAMAPFVDRLRDAAVAARRAGIEGLRDLLLTGARESASLRSPDDLRDRAEIQAALRRIADAASARRRVQREAIDAVATVDPALGNRMFHRWVADTCPEFLRDGAAWKTASDLAAAGPPPDRGDGGSLLARGAIERWTIVDDDLARRVAEWQDSERQEPPAASPADLVRLSAVDPAMAAMRTLRDESSWRLLRISATSAGRAPDALMPDEDVRRGSPRSVRWAAP